MRRSSLPGVVPVRSALPGLLRVSLALVLILAVGCDGGGSSQPTVQTPTPSRAGDPAADPAADPGAGPATDATADSPTPAQAGRWEPVGSLVLARSSHSVVALPDGGALLFGGVGPGGVPLATVERFEAQTDSFRAAGRMLTARVDAAAVLLSGGDVLLAGGVVGDAGAAVAPAVEVFNPTSGESRALPDPPVTATPGEAAETAVARVLLRPTAVALDGGDALVLPGRVPGIVPAEVYRWHAGERRWSVLSLVPEGASEPPVERGSPVLAALPRGGPGQTDHRVAVLGGDRSGSTVVLDLATGRAVPGAPLVRGRATARVATLPDGRVLLAGGSGWPSRVLELWSPPSARSAAGGEAAASVPVPEPRGSGWQPELAALPDGRVLLAGGVAADDGGTPGVVGYVRRSFLFDPVAFEVGGAPWTPAGALRGDRSGFSMTALADGSVLVAGGAVVRTSFLPFQQHSEWLSTAERWFPAAPERPGR